MPAALRYLLYTLAGLLALGGTALAGLLFLFDPNDFKPQIEKLAEHHTRLDLQLDGDISWSLFPLGLELNAVTARLDNEAFLAVDHLIARVSLTSLIKMQPAVHRFELAGLDVNLAVNSEGHGNWERILPEASSTTSAEADTQTSTKTGTKSQQPPKTATATATPAERELTFNISEVSIRDTRLRYSDQSTGQTFTVDELSLQATGIQPGRAFPLSLGFHAAIQEPALDIRSKLSTKLTLGDGFQQFVLADMSGSATVQGEATNQRSIDLAVSGTVDADLANSQISLSGLSLALNKLKLSTDLVVHQFDTTPQLAGKVAIAEFSARELLSQLGQTLPAMQDATTLRRLSLQAEIGGEPGTIQLKPLTISLDDSKLGGELRYTLENGALFSRLNLDRINADRYLPPPAETPEQTTATAPESDLLPLETIRALNLDLGLNIGELTISEIALNKLQLKAIAANGLVTVKPLSGQVFEGSFNASSVIDARKAAPLWQLQASASDIRTLQLLSQLADMKQFSGLANLKLDLNSKGNRISTLRENAKGQADFNIQQGKLEGTSMAAYACQGIALIHKEPIDTSTWPRVTSFENMGGTVTINGNVIDNTALKAQLKGMALEGKGKVDIASMNLDYRAGLRILGNIHDDPACRINDRLTNLVIPVKCKGSLADESLPCGFDEDRFGDTLAKMAKAEVKQKADEKIEEEKEKLREKAQKKLEKFFTQ